MRRLRRMPAVLRAFAVVLLAIVAAGCPKSVSLDLGAPEPVADGVRLYRLYDPELLDPAGPVAVQVLRLDPSRVDVRAALAGGRVVQLDTVPAIARREGAIAAVNAGFFVVKTGDPAGILEVGDELVSDSPLTRGAVGIIRKAAETIGVAMSGIATIMPTKA